MMVYASNGSPVGDGARITRVSQGGAKFEVLVDIKDFVNGWREVQWKEPTGGNLPPALKSQTVTGGVKGGS